MDYGLLMSSFASEAAGRKLTQQMLLYESLRHAILNGDIRHGTQLVPTRALAEQLGIARNSVLYAYERLAEEGFIAASRHGSIVSCVALPGANAEASIAAPVSRLSRRVAGLPPDRGSTRGTGGATGMHAPFQAGVPALDEFPVAQWRASMERAWRSVDARDLGYGYYAGHPSLRRAVAEYVRVSRSVRCAADQVFITSGTHTSLDLCARMLADPGDSAWLENPGYHGARIAFQSAGLNVVPIPVDAAGIAPTDEHWQRTPPRLVYITPSHQYPLGSVLGLERRWSIIDNVVERGAWIIEDDYDSELRHSGPPLPSVQGLRPATPVVYLGTFSKTMFPALRIGFMIVPANLAPEIGSVIGEMSRQGRIADQIALADFIESGKYARHLRRMRRIYQQRREAMVSAIHQHMRDLVTVSSDGSGMHLTMRLDAPLQDRDVSIALREKGIAVSPLSAYCHQGEDAARYNGFMLGYAGVHPDKADRLVAELGAAIRSLTVGKRY
ncbi:aminotransferase class I/II-fold pyridoxal phosphate-dependent enzyme [Paraburkholderia sp. CNPSo 3157]|uniref:Aminotransferase class I/II-fold pyridoxal phosphate-dependent enzyme n=1 Tax=Paraburkholderia franconis TaxID=2654983 RepID=A0A7X1TDV2_9BURK|nr:PLP-dependent aminotransferase family protein [Paraburkholderia franconis]MPW15551.1 aminotransferase class I/II-fold pyridoxal phosphate-dependent enzyme [Paraburkholderia franconis]